MPCCCVDETDSNGDEGIDTVEMTCCGREVDGVLCCMTENDGVFCCEIETEEFGCKELFRSGDETTDALEREAVVVVFSELSGATSVKAGSMVPQEKNHKTKLIKVDR
ncbi:hypothetical protein V6N11_032762 [Hibiscus sabdariffa]|uniref:Uncharacterized protein n=1 Tax=Hibiscus sabdariffa TaxID=183260 RepID=A0ABR2T1S7_9ROSI